MPAEVLIGSRMVLLSYLALILTQTVWHFLLPSPLGIQSWILALVATLPLLLPLRGILNANFRSMIWGSFLAVLYFVIGVMEAWSNPPQRIPALAQVILALAYCGFFALYSRKGAIRAD